MTGQAPEPIALEIEPAGEGPRLRFWQRISRRESLIALITFGVLGCVLDLAKTEDDQLFLYYLRI